MHVDNYINSIELALRPLSNAYKAQKMKAYLLNQFDFMGISAALQSPDFSGFCKAALNSERMCTSVRAISYLEKKFLLNS